MIETSQMWDESEVNIVPNSNVDVLKVKALIVENKLNNSEFGKLMGWGKNTTTSRLNDDIEKRSRWTVEDVINACNLLHITKDKEKCNIFLS